MPDHIPRDNSAKLSPELRARIEEIRTNMLRAVRSLESYNDTAAARHLLDKLAALDELVALAEGSGWRPDQEAIAKIINPFAFGHSDAATTKLYAGQRAAALRRADMILALPPSPEGEE